MTTQEFCLWLKPYLDRDKAEGLTPAETAAIRQRLSDVFRHAIDPALGDAAHQALLHRIHDRMAH